MVPRGPGRMAGAGSRGARGRWRARGGEDPARDRGRAAVGDGETVGRASEGSGFGAGRQRRGKVLRRQERDEAGRPVCRGAGARARRGAAAKGGRSVVSASRQPMDAGHRRACRAHAGSRYAVAGAAAAVKAGGAHTGRGPVYLSWNGADVRA